MFNLKEISKKHFFQPSWYSLFINPYFIARYGLLNKIKVFAKNDFSGQIFLDIGCGGKPYQNLFLNLEKYIGIDVEGGGHKDEAKNVDKFYDGKIIPFSDNNFDVVICTQVLEHVEDPIFLLQEINRILKPGGKIFLTMPFVWNEHETPFDFRRFTRYEHIRVFEKAGLKIETIEATTGLFGVCGQLISAFIFEEINPKKFIFKLLIAFLFCFPVQLIFIILDFVFKNSWLTLDYVINAKKYEI